MSKELVVKRARRAPTPLKPSRDNRSKLTHDRRILILAIMAGLPGAVVSLIMLWHGDYQPRTQWTLSVLVLGCWFGFAFALVDGDVGPLRPFPILLSTLR